MKNYYTLRRVGFWNCAVVVIFVGGAGLCLVRIAWCAYQGGGLG